MQFGQLTNPTKDVLKEVKSISKWADYVEIGFEPPVAKPENVDKYVSQINKILKKKDIFAISHFAWYADFASSIEIVRGAWVSEAKKAIEISHKMSVKKFNIHINPSKGMTKKSKYMKNELNNLVKSAKELVKFAKKFGIEVMIENITEDKFSEFKYMNYVVKNTPGLKVHLDVGHAFCVDEYKEIEKYFKVFGKNLIHVHISDNFGEEDDHLQLGDGKINWKKVAKIIKKYKYDRTITPEIFNGRGGAKRAASVLKKYLLKI
jgi:sugar phosphate isomerase/epimerase